jgi:glucose-1-phosphate cytidylyltransferase
MKVVILTGGVGSRFSSESPKALAMIGEKAILWHIMKHYSHYGFNDFIIVLGYFSKIIKKELPKYCSDEFNVQFIETGLNTKNGSRIKQIEKYVDKNTFMLTWCDGLSDINFHNLLNFHRSHKKLATVTAVNPVSKYGYLEIRQNKVISFNEKPRLKNDWVNGAFFILEPGIFEYIPDHDCQWENEPMFRLTRDGELMAFKHESFWYSMDTFKDNAVLNKMWKSDQAKWKIW